MPETRPTGPPAAPGRAVRRRLRETDCPACGHAWEEHPGVPSVGGDECSACRDGLDHDEAPEGAACCSAPVPPELLRTDSAPPAGPEPWWHRFALFPIRVLLAVLDGLT